MPSKENYCYWILRKYSLIVDFSGIPTRKSVPAPVSGETYSQWRKRVLGDNVSDVVLYAPYEPKPNKRIATLQNEAGANHLKKIFAAFKKAKEAEAESAITEAVEVVEQRFASFSKDTLEDLVAELEENLEPSVKEFFYRFSKTVEPNVDTEQLLRELINAYNCAVRQYNRECG